jgi:acetolactate synthase-1/2/3 large subunit
VQRIAGAYGIKYFRLDQSQNLTERIKEILNFPNAVLCEVMCIRDQEIIPGVASVRKEDGSMMSKPLEDMYPFLDREEFRKQMIVKPIPE